MAKLVWDKAVERKFEMGTRHAVLFPMGDNDTYEKGVVWNGITGFTVSPDGAEPNDLYADDMKYATLRSAENTKATIEAYTYPVEYLPCDGYATPVPGVRIGQQARKSFGFVIETQEGNATSTESDDSYNLHILWGCTSSPSEKGYETINDSPDAITFSWEIDTTPVVLDGYKPTSYMCINSKECDETKFQTLLDTLHGTETEEPRLPSPAQVLAMLSNTTNP